MAAACMQVETLIEVFALGMERAGRGNRYGLLLCLEVVKWVHYRGVSCFHQSVFFLNDPSSMIRSSLKLLMWGDQGCSSLFLRQPQPEDLDLMESQKGVRVRGC